uniref:Transporter n=1 Tax=Latimeria chalumnae TaxID=7897 RepID=H3B6Q8_LATCH
SPGCVSIPVPERETWSRQMDFIMSCVGFAVGLGNVWRFPYLCYKNGGGVFLIPYLLVVFVGGIPVFFLEIALGQFMKQGGISAWNIAPLFKGLGFASMVIVFFCNTYYIMILVWGLYYLAHSFTDPLPWATCGNPWNTKECTEVFASEQCRNLSAANLSAVNGSCEELLAKRSPVIEFWENKVLQISGGLNEPGEVNWQMTLCLLATWVIVYFCIWKGVKSTGKVVYFTALFPYVVLIVLLAHGVTLPGALDGIVYYLKPNWSKLAEAQVRHWLELGLGLSFCISLSLSVCLSLSFLNNCSFLSKVLFLLHSGSSSSSAVDKVLIQGTPRDQAGLWKLPFSSSGPGLAFIAYPKAVTLMPAAPFWAALFFFMLLVLGLDSQFVGVEGFITGIMDMLPNSLIGVMRRELVVAVCCLICFILDLSMVTKVTSFSFFLSPYFSFSGTGMDRIYFVWVWVWVCLCVSLCIGADRFMDDIACMIGYRPLPFMKWCWAVVTPCVCVPLKLHIESVWTEGLRYKKSIWEGVWGGEVLSRTFMLVQEWSNSVALSLTFCSLDVLQRWQHLTTPVWGHHHLEFMTPEVETKLLTPDTQIPGNQEKVTLFETVI